MLNANEAVHPGTTHQRRVTVSKTNDETPPAQQKPDLVAQYRPVGLKAVLAAALQHKAKPIITTTPRKQPV